MKEEMEERWVEGGGGEKRRVVEREGESERENERGVGVERG